MGKAYGLLAGATVAVVLVTPLWHDTSAAERSLAQRVESIVVPTAAAAVFAPTMNATRDLSEHVDAAGLLVAGTTLFGLAAAVRRAL
jgi:hypothetical protein